MDLLSLLLAALTWIAGDASSCGPTHDMIAIRALMRFKAAEQAFYQQSGRYGRAEELAALDPEWMAALTAGKPWCHYYYRTRVSTGHFSIVAAPESEDWARKSFYLDESFVMRERWEPGLASRNSPVLR